MKIAPSTIFTLLFSFLLAPFGSAQMLTPQGTLFGNEWIDYSKDYLKFEVSQDGIYQIKASTLSSNGFDISQPKRLQMWHNGAEVPIYISSGENAMESSDFIEFVGFKNTIALDTFLYEDWKKDLLNPNYGLFTDISSYYIVMSDQDSGNKRFSVANPDYNDNSVEVLEYYRHQSITNFPNSFYKPQIGELKYSHFQPSEGYTTGLRNNVDAPISINGFVPQGDAPTVRLYLANNNNFPIIKSIKWNNTEVALDSTGSGRTSKINFTVEAGKFLNENNLNIKITNNFGLFGLASVETSYNRAFDFSTIDFTIAQTSSNKRKITTTGLSPFITQIYDLHNLKAIKLGPNGAVIADRGAKLVFGKTVTELNVTAKKKFKNISSLDASFLFLTSEKLYDGKTPGNPIDDYAAYRSSSQGGGFKTEILTVQEVYDQFGYGIPNHDWAFKNMSHYLKEHWPSLQYVLIVGKAREYQNVRTPALLANPVNASFMVPTFGTSPSDVLLFSPGRYVNSYFAIGRIAAANLEEVKIYLDKVKQHDIAINAPQEKDKLWLKNIVHLGGGADGGERSSITWFLDRMSDTIQKGAFGANVSAFYKTSSTDIQIANLKAISENISKGASIVTFFGHASIGAFEFNLDNPYNYANEGKYPFIFSLGCYSGNIHSPSKGISEDFIFAKDRGAIAFIASAGTAYLSTQGIYGTKFYAKLTSDFYNQRLGDMFKLFGEKEKDVFTTGEYTLYQQLTFHGDPAVKLIGFEKPDYSFDYQSVKISPTDILETSTEMKVEVDLLNIGKFEDGNVSLKAFLIMSEGDTSKIKNITVARPKSSNTIQFELPLENPKPGIGRLYIEIDPSNEVEEIEENNNELANYLGKGFEFLVISDQIKPNYPSNYSIATNEDDKVVLIGSSTNAFAKPTTYKLQLDTTDLFNSALLYEAEINNVVSFIEFVPNFDFKDSTTYYWRIASVNDQMDHLVWQKSSFTYISKSYEGWTKQHRYQNENNTYINSYLNEAGKIEFDKRIRQLQLRSEIYSLEIPHAIVDGGHWGALTPNNGTKDAINVAIFTELGPYANQNGNKYGSSSSDGNIVFSFDPNLQSSRKGIHDLLQDIPENSDVFIWFHIKDQSPRFGLEQWENDKSVLGYTIYEVMSQYGAEYFSLIKDKGVLPYCYNFHKKNGKIGEVIGETLEDGIKYTGYFYPKYPNGQVIYSNIGPSEEFFSMEWEAENVENSDIITYDVILTSETGKIDTILTNQTSKILDLKAVNSNKNVNRLSIKFNLSDEINRTAANIKSLLVKYKTLPDLLIKSFVIPDSIEDGQSQKLSFSVYNISKDTIFNINNLISATNTRNQHTERNVDIEFIPPMTSIDKSLITNFTNLTSTNKFSLNINNKNEIPEENYKNNVSSRTLHKLEDKINPILNVLFDGVEILDGDMVSSHPKVTIKLKDNSRFNLLDDINLFDLKLLKNGDSKPLDVMLTEQNLLTFTPAQEGKNETMLEFSPTLENGTYNLAVQARDKSGNLSGDNAYSINFIIDNQKGFKNLMNYPNPFSTSTQFVFEITGSVPNTLKLQIFSISGKIVREFNQAEIGNLKIGKNITTLHWDGRDQFEAPLANGVYLYSITSSDSDFTPNKNSKLNFGKIVIIR